MSATREQQDGFSARSSGPSDCFLKPGDGSRSERDACRPIGDPLDRVGHVLRETLRGSVDAISADLVRRMGWVAASPVVGLDILARLTRAGLLRDSDLMSELVDRIRLDLISDALPIWTAHAHGPSLLVRLTDAPDPDVGAAAKALLVADARRRSMTEDGVAEVCDLPAALHHRLIWWIAAAIRGEDGFQRDTIEMAASNAAADHDGGERAEASALRLAAAIAARPAEMADLLIESLGDRRARLFVAFLSHALDLPYGQVRTAVLDAEGDGLWLAMRAADLDRVTMAQVAFALAEADPGRNIWTFADDLDRLMRVTTTEARRLLSPLFWHRDYRTAVQALGTMAQ